MDNENLEKESEYCWCQVGILREVINPDFALKGDTTCETCGKKVRKSRFDVPKKVKKDGNMKQQQFNFGNLD